MNVSGEFRSRLIAAQCILHACRFPKGCPETGRKDVPFVPACCSGELLHWLCSVLPCAKVLVCAARQRHRSTRSTAHAWRGMLPPK